MPRIRVTATQLPDRHCLISCSANVATIVKLLKRPGKNGRRAKTVALYIGFDSQREAIGAAQDIRRDFPNAGIEVRPAKRLGTAWEVKVRHAAVEMLLLNLLAATPTTGQQIDRHVIDFQQRQRLQQQAQTRAAALAKPSQRDIASAPLAAREKPALAKCGDRLVTIG
jgi:hypothetical protein